MNTNNKNKKALLISRKDAFNIENIIEFVSNNFDTTILVENREKNFPLFPLKETRQAIHENNKIGFRRN